MQVLNAFNAGGAQIGGGRTVHQTDIADDLDISIGRHALRTGFLIEAGQFRTDIRRNAAGTFTFASLDAFNAGLPTTFARNVGDPLVSVSAVQAGLYIQDDFRVRKDLTISGGVRAGIPVAGRRVSPRSARRLRLVAVQERQDDAAGRRGHLLRLVRRPELRADRAARRHTSAD